MKNEFERGRRTGIDQCVKFLIESEDEPQLAKDMKNWVRKYGEDATDRVIMNAHLNLPDPFEKAQE